VSTASATVPVRRNPIAALVGGVGRRIRGFWIGISAVGAKELRGRMRGRRAFVVVTVYLLLLSAFAFGIYIYLRQQAELAAAVPTDEFGMSLSPGYALTVQIGHAVFSGLLIVETVMVLLLAPAFTAGAISSERERQTMELLAATPLSSLGLVIGKLFSALTYVFLLILASIPLMAIVFVFGGVGPEDVVRAYLLLFTLAFGMGAIGLFMSALVRRTQPATILTYVIVLAVAFGSVAVHAFWTTITTTRPQAPEGFVTVQRPNRAPQALLALNPLVGDLDLICTTAPGGYERFSCGYVAWVTGTPYFGAGAGDPFQPFCPPNQPCAIEGGVMIDRVVMVKDLVAPARGLPQVDVFVDDAVAAPGPGVVAEAGDQELASFGFPRDKFWPVNAATFLLVGFILTVLSAQLVAPTRRLHRLRLRRSRPAPPPTTEVTP
jgi:ABC-type transport system involved in multi-copper enzyme maturation permease subunit